VYDFTCEISRIAAAGRTPFYTQNVRNSIYDTFPRGRSLESTVDAASYLSTKILVYKYGNATDLAEAENTATCVATQTSRVKLYTYIQVNLHTC
jgi:hypothetical protein